MSKTKSDAERQEFLKGLGLNPEAPGLSESTPAMVTHQPATSGNVVLAPPSMDPRTMPVDEITLDPHLLDGFPSLAGDGLAAASAHVFALYKSYGRNKERNGALHRKITSFITLTRRNRETGGMVKEAVKADKETRDLAALLASQGITAARLAALLAEEAK